MKISTKKAHPLGKGRNVTRAYRITGTGAGGSRLPDDTDSVSLSLSADDGVDLSTSTRLFIMFGLDDRGEDIDHLIAKLTDLRINQRRLAGSTSPEFITHRAPCGDIHDAPLGAIVAGRAPEPALLITKNGEAFCSCGRRLSACDKSRRGCTGARS